MSQNEKKALIDVVVVYHVTIVAIGHGCLEEILAYYNRLRSMVYCKQHQLKRMCVPDAGNLRLDGADDKLLEQGVQRRVQLYTNIA